MGRDPDGPLKMVDPNSDEFHCVATMMKSGYLLTTGRQPGKSNRGTGKIFQPGADKNEANRATGKSGQPGADSQPGIIRRLPRVLFPGDQWLATC